MSELTREEKLKLVEKLPQRLQDFLYSEDTGAFLLYLEEKYSLDDEKTSSLSKIVGDVILGITPITSLAQETVNKVTPDPQTAMAIAQELNNELLMPVLTPTPATPPTPAVPPAIPIVPPIPTAPIPTAPAAPRADQYREPTTGGEIVDLRKTPLPPMPMPVAVAPIPARQRPEPQAMAGGPPPPKPLTFTKPVEPIKTAPLIEAEPHKTVLPASDQKIKESADSFRTQYIIRPPGLAPTDMPHGVLDLRKDKGEF